MKQKIKYSGRLRSYWQWSLMLVFCSIILDIALLFVDLKSAIVASIFSAVYIITVLLVYFFYKPRIVAELVNFATNYGQIQKVLLREFAIPYGLLETNGKIIWMNDQMCEITGKNRTYHKSISNLFPQVNDGFFPENDEEVSLEIRYGERDYQVLIQRICIDELLDATELIEGTAEDNHLLAVYLFDITLQNQYIRENQENQPVVGLIYIDNYDEVQESVEEVRSSLLAALIDRKINKYITSMGGLVKKLEKDKYFIMLTQKNLPTLKSDRFSLLEDVKMVNVGNEMGVTLSIGLGINGDGYIQGYEYARGAMELALGRGGDQAVLKDGEKITYYGGKTQLAERNTRVKARVKAQALREIMTEKETVVVMGHKVTDIDTLGAAVGIYCAARIVGKKAHIVTSDITGGIKPWVQIFTEDKEYDHDFFVSHQQAKELVNDQAVLVVVDTNRPSMTECEELLDRTNTVVVLDHHRQGSQQIENAALSYIEPSASSACEMVAEILQYFDEYVRLRPREADCIYAGIIIDTNNFLAKTGVRTFEAAAFLRRKGADVTRVRKMFRDDMATYKARAEAVRHAEVYMDRFAISRCPSEGLDNPTVVGAQAANELLNIVGVKASFVLTPFNRRIYISARAIDEVNVQIIMERLGGGGHMNIAGAQLDNISEEQAVEVLKQTLREMTEEKAI